MQKVTAFLGEKWERRAMEKPWHRYDRGRECHGVEMVLGHGVRERGVQGVIHVTLSQQGRPGRPL